MLKGALEDSINAVKEGGVADVLQSGIEGVYKCTMR